jgi:hypothetical protein
MTTPHNGSPRIERRTWRARFRAWFTERLGLKFTALLITVLIWLLVGARERTESFVPVSVTPVLDSSLVLLGDPPRLRALVAGSTADIVKLYATPPEIRRSIGGDVPDTLVLDLTPSDVRIPPELSADVRVLDVQPRSVTLRFETKASSDVAVLNGGRIRVQFAGGAPAPAGLGVQAVTVGVSGPRRVVRRLRGVFPVALTLAAGDTLPHVADLDTAGLGVTVSPAQVKVRASGTPMPPATAAAP